MGLCTVMTLYFSYIRPFIDSDVGQFGVNVVKYGPLLTDQRHLKFVVQFCVDPFTKFHWNRAEGRKQTDGQTHSAAVCSFCTVCGMDR